MKSLKESLSGYFLCLVEIIVGVLLLINPLGFTSTIVVGVGCALIILGIVCIINYFRTEVNEASAKQLLLKGLISLLAGGFCTIRSRWIVATFTILTIIYGMVILVSGLSKIQKMVDMLRLKNNKWFIPAIGALISIICGVVILMRPFATTAILWIFTGITLIVEAVIDFVTIVVNNKKKDNTESGM